MNDTFTHNGREYRIEINQDDQGRPWKEYDGHGIVRGSRIRHSRRHASDKRPSERPLNSPDRHEYQLYYDWRASLALALRDGWGCEGGRRPGESRRAYAARAVQKDFDYLRRYVAGDTVWQWVKVTSPSGEVETMGGTLDEWGGPLVMERARELADQLEQADKEAEQVARDTLVGLRAVMHRALISLRLRQSDEFADSIRYTLRAAHKAACDAVEQIRTARGEA